ncbi:D-alanyl-D-alanine carboxypeptidase [Streptomyces albireticuli]|uniref:D-alanyl-D-alanine carboxypeptidase n=1 Tax=Streptomyces albireticuli TaxID=1940 RepID=A0A2A2D9R3_9ACTN|nr:serine hydrolase [Streptomyces albireticuli]MCD9144393.1 serine hydrolase [Streptomyces albireticuli]MCD9163544.1 serine hydrolase [Streptomyces albireticuli]MCD9193070.1 serine hydrolase [Streptomyces albireticuli]PAU48052.1 D-alanyl-D-alanine carboxypeptidase [Streptomyces albireticuli]
MAGESPDKSEQRKSSGETTVGERDPRLGVFRDSGKSGADSAAPKAADTDADAKSPSGEAKSSGAPKAGDARLKAAVAAWVVGEDEDGADSAGGARSGEAERSAASAVDGGDDTAAAAASRATDAPAKSPAEGAAGDGRKAPADRATRSETGGDPEVPAKAETGGDARTSAKGAEAAGKGSGAPADRATAVFRTVPPKAEGGADAPAEAAKASGKDAGAGDSGKASGKDGAAPADRATAVFGAVRPKGDSETPAKSADAPAKGEKAPAKGEGVPADRATAVFGAVRPKGDSGSEAPAKGEGASARSAGEGGSEAPAKGERASARSAGDGGSEAPAKGEKAPAKGEDAPADQATAVFRAVRPKGDSSAEAPAKGDGADRATAAFGVLPPKKNGKAAASVDQPTELLKAPEVGPETKGETPAESDSERTSQFVPLKSLDAAPAKPKKAAGPAKGAKPAIPVSVTPPAPTKAQPPKGAPAKDGAAAVPEVPAQPAAPLDLLAQLTNTPPPPETPARNAMRRVKIWTPLVVLLLIVFCAVQAFRPLPDTKLSIASAKATFTFGGEKFAMPWPGEGQAAAMVQGVGSLGTYGEEKPVPTASVAKVMTAYVILKNHPLQKGDKGPEIEVDAEAENESKSQDESRVPLTKGEKFSEYDMLQMLLIPSGNNAARLLARWDAQTREAFVAKMNAAAKELGMSKTTYTDPSGFDKTTVSTAVDQLKLAEAVMKDEVFREIVAKPNADVTNGPHLNNNNDELLLKVGVLGIKTGSSTPAGGALMWAAKRTVGGKEHLILGATMDQHFKGGPDPNAENSLKMVKTVSYKMIKAVQDSLTSTTIVKKGDVVGYVEDGLGGKTPVVATKDLTGAGWPGMTAKLTIGKGAKAVPHEAKAGTEVGELTVGSGTGAMKVPVALKKDLVEPSFGAKLTRLG